MIRHLLPGILLPLLIIACGDDAGDSGGNGSDTTIVNVDVDVDHDEGDRGDLVDSGSYQGSDSIAEREPGDSSPDTFDGTVMELAGGAERYQGDIPTLLDVRTGYHQGYDRIVFEFSGKGLPGWQTEYIDKPAHECGSGKELFLAGDGWLEVRFEGTNAHTDEGQPTIISRRRLLSLPNLKELALTCDFEANVTWVLGLSSPEPYRAIELENPTRLVIDVRHPSR